MQATCPSTGLPPSSLCLECRATFDTDNIDIGPERRAFLEHRLERVWEVNSQVRCCCCCGDGGSGRFSQAHGWPDRVRT